MGWGPASGRTREWERFQGALRRFPHVVAKVMAVRAMLDAEQAIPWPDQKLVFHHKYRFWVQPFTEVRFNSILIRFNSTSIRH